MNDEEIIYLEPNKTNKLNRGGRDEANFENTTQNWNKQDINSSIAYCYTCARRDFEKRSFTGKKEDYESMYPLKDVPVEKIINNVTKEKVVVCWHRDFECFRNPRHKKTITIPANLYKKLDLGSIKREPTPQEKLISEGFTQIYDYIFAKKLSDGRSCCKVFCYNCNNFVNEQTLILEKGISIECTCHSCDYKNRY